MPRRNRQEKKRSTPEDSGSSRGGRSGRLPRVEPTGVVRPLPPHLAKPAPEAPAPATD